MRPATQQWVLPAHREFDGREQSFVPFTHLRASPLGRAPLSGKPEAYAALNAVWFTGEDANPLSLRVGLPGRGNGRQLAPQKTSLGPAACQAEFTQRRSALVLVVVTKPSPRLLKLTL